MTNYFALGSYRRSITTASGEAQLWFDRADKLDDSAPVILPGIMQLD